jgi:hypothetical protein
MPRKSLAPAFIVSQYTTTFNAVIMAHVMTTPVNVVAWAGAATVLTKKGGTTEIWSTAILDLWNTILPMYHTSSVVTQFELWRQDNAAADPSLVDTFAPVGLVGGSAGATVMASGVTYTFRSTEDTPFRLVMIESNQAANQRLAYSTMSSTQKAPVDYIIGNDSIVYARSNAYIATFGLFTTKGFNKIRKKRLGL